MIIVDQIITLDGYSSRLDGSIDYFIDRREVVDSYGFPERMSSVSDILLGARTYREFVSYWPTQSADLPINRLRKHVVSTSLSSAPWGSLPEVEIHSQGVEAAVEALGRAAAKHIIVWGSLSLARRLLELSLVDELWLRTVPLTLGHGRHIFPCADLTLTPLASVNTTTAGCTSTSYRVEQIRL